MEQQPDTEEAKKIKYRIYQRDYRRNKKTDPEYRKNYNAYMIEYYNKNKNPLNCGCGGRFLKANIAYHNSTKKHLKYLSEQTPVVYETH